MRISISKLLTIDENLYFNITLRTWNLFQAPKPEYAVYPAQINKKDKYLNWR